MYLRLILSRRSMRLQGRNETSEHRRKAREEKNDSIIRDRSNAREQKSEERNRQACSDGINVTSDKRQRDSLNIFRLFAKKCAIGASDQQPSVSFENSLTPSQLFDSRAMKAKDVPQTAYRSESFDRRNVAVQISQNLPSAKLIRFPTRTLRMDVSQVLSMTPTEYSPFDEEPDFCFLSIDTDGYIPHTFSANPFDEDEMSSITMVEFSPSQNLDDISL